MLHIMRHTHSHAHCTRTVRALLSTSLLNHLRRKHFGFTTTVPVTPVASVTGCR